MQPWSSTKAEERRDVNDEGDTYQLPDKALEDHSEKQQEPKDEQGHSANDGKRRPLVVAAGWVQQLSVFWFTAHVHILAEPKPDGLQLLQPSLQHRVFAVKWYSPASLAKHDHLKAVARY